MTDPVPTHARALAAPRPTGRGATLDVVSRLLGLHAVRPGDDPGRAIGAVGPASAPRFLVPLATPEAAAASCLAYARLREARTGAVRRVVGRALRTPAARFVIGERFTMDTGPGSLVEHVRRAVGRDDLVVGVGLGHPTGVWKPTLQAFGADGTPLAYVKLGWNAVTADLVRTEAAALAHWAATAAPRLVVPGLLDHSQWESTVVTAVAPLPLDARRLPTGPLPGAQPVREFDGPVVEAELLATPWWEAIARTIEAGIDHPTDAGLRTALRRVEATQAGQQVSLGHWHGDWVPWNLARCSTGLIAWDWEYSEAGAPVGLDELHGAYQVATVGRGLSPAEGFTRSAVGHPAMLADVHALAIAARLQRQVQAGAPADELVDTLAAAARFVVGFR